MKGIDHVQQEVDVCDGDNTKAASEASMPVGCIRHIESFAFAMTILVSGWASSLGSNGIA